ncbi:hypothetical protein H6G01_00895 [Leptolyngbya sp. FACHB-17]|nr:hypothetical protein [Leptolyngbya sp. FACHB-17]MBD2078481.1 hypothetical protein [Leptolyngbya sp. FACHB-17]
MPIRATSAPVLWLAILTFMPNYVECARKRATAVPLSARSMTMTTVSDAPSLVVAVPIAAARWQQQWRKTHSPTMAKFFNRSLQAE